MLSIISGECVLLTQQLDSVSLGRLAGPPSSQGSAYSQGRAALVWQGPERKWFQLCGPQGL